MRGSLVLGRDTGNELQPKWDNIVKTYRKCPQPIDKLWLVGFALITMSKATKPVTVDSRFSR